MIAPRAAGLVTVAALALSCDGSDVPTLAVNAQSTPTPPVVASVTVTPERVTFDQLGKTLQLTALVHDSEGNVTSEPVDWSSDDPSTASVSANGVVTARAAGTVQVRAAASCCGLSDASSITVSPASNGGGDPTYPNKPAEASRLLQIRGDQLIPGDGFSVNQNWRDKVRVVNDAGAVFGKALEFTHKVSEGGQSSPGNGTVENFVGNPEPTTLYIMYRLKYPTDYFDAVPHGRGLKHFYWGAAGVPQKKYPTIFYDTIEHDGTINVTNQIAMEGVPVADVLVGKQAWADKMDNQWHDMEVVITAESEPGAADGSVRYWLDGELIAENLSVQWVPATADYVGFDGFHLWNTRDYQFDADTWFRVGEIYVAGY